MFDVDDIELKQYRKNLEALSKDAFPKAVRSTLDKLAYETKKQYTKNVKKDLVIRGKSNIVTASIGYNKCAGTLDIDNMESIVGQRATTFGKKSEQLRTQEFGEPIIAKGKHTFKATKFARGGSYRKIVSRENFLAGMDILRIDDLTNNPSSDPKKQMAQAVAIVHRTLDEGKYIHFMPDNDDSDKKFGVYRLYNTGSKTYRKGNIKTNGKSIRFMYSFSGKTQNIDAKPMLKNATAEVFENKKTIFLDEIKRRTEKELSKGLRQQ